MDIGPMIEPLSFTPDWTAVGVRTKNLVTVVDYVSLKFRVALGSEVFDTHLP